MASNIHSPLAPVFEGFALESIPLAFRMQFLAQPGDANRTALIGVMHAIWHNPAWLGPLYKLLGKFGILVERTGRHVPARLDVIPGTLPDGKPFHEWNRTFAFEPPLTFNTTVVYDERWRNLADQVGSPRFLHMVWEGRFHAPRKFTLRTVSNAIRVSGRLFYLPGWLWKLLLGSVDFVQIAHQDDPALVDVDLRIKHPILGEIFGYRGTFRAQHV